MNVVIYARFSSHNQREESIEGQLRECHAFAEKHDYTVIHEYCDRALSGKSDKRPEFQKMIKDSEKGNFQGVIMYTLDRFARNRYDSAIYKAKLKKNGVKIMYATQNIADTPEGIILESVLEGYAEYYSENLSRNIKRGMKDSVLHGKYITKAPFGYYIDENTTIKKHPQNADAVKMIFTKFVSGESYQNIADWLNSAGFKTSVNKPFRKTSIPRILNNTKYLGYFYYENMKFEMPQIIDENTFNQVQEIYKMQSKHTQRTRAQEEYILTTKLFCGACGSMMYGECGTSKTGKIYRYYKCSNKKNTKNCDKANEKKEILEDFIIGECLKLIFTDAAIEEISNKVVEMTKTVKNEEDFELQNIEIALKECNQKINNVIKAIEQGFVSNTLKETLETAEKEKDELEQQKAKIELKKRKSIEKEQVVFWLNKFKKGDINSEKTRKSIIQSIINKIYIYDKENCTEFEIYYNLFSGNKIIKKKFVCNDAFCTKLKHRLIAVLFLLL